MLQAVRKRLVPALAATLVCGVGAADPGWQLVKPSTTGIPGEEVRLMKFDSAGDLWVVARWPFWSEAGLARLPASELPFNPLPGGGFDTGAWTTWSNVDHPIPSVYINDIEFAAGGVIWLASDGGLTRFDPQATTPEQMWFTFTAANSPLILDQVRSLDQDSQGNLWLTNVSPSSSDGALFKLNPASWQWTEYRVGQELPWSPPWFNVNEVWVGHDDRVWLTHSVLTGLAEYTGTSWVLHAAPAQLNDPMEDLDGNVWITSPDTGLWKWNGTSFQNWPTLGGTVTTTALGMDAGSGFVYVGTWYGDVFTMVGGTTPTFFVNAGSMPYAIEPRPDGDVWISNHGGSGSLGRVRHYTGAGQLLERFNTYNTGLPEYFIDTIQVDSGGHLWFASGYGGLSHFDGTRWRNFGILNDGAEPYPFGGSTLMSGMLEDSHGSIWMAGNGVARWDPVTGTFTGFWDWSNSSLPADQVDCLAEAGDGTIWAGTDYSGAFHYDAASNDWVEHNWAPPGWTANEVEDMAVDASGQLWVLTFVALHRLDGTTWTTWDSTNSPLPLGSLFALAPDPSAGVWVGAHGMALHFDGSTWTVIDQAQAGWPGTNVVDIAIRSTDGLMALATNQPEVFPYTGGVSVFDGQAWTHWMMANSPLPHWQVAAVEFDLDGDLWASPMSEGVVQILIGATLFDDGFESGDTGAWSATLP